jgi:cyclophilin family peptidyl-prolyl cis-trans isomerase
VTARLLCGLNAVFTNRFNNALRIKWLFVALSTCWASKIKVGFMGELVVIETTAGKFELELDRRLAPQTVDNFVKYVKAGFYEGTVFHRVIPGFMVQGGGFTADGRQKPTRPPIGLEVSGGLKNLTGTIAMARTNDPDSATGQFFINVADNDFLNHSDSNDGYAVFGKVSSGLPVVMSVSKVKTGSKNGMEDWPLEPIVIRKAEYKG